MEFVFLTRGYATILIAFRQPVAPFNQTRRCDVERTYLVGTILTVLAAVWIIVVLLLGLQRIFVVFAIPLVLAGFGLQFYAWIKVGRQMAQRDREFKEIIRRWRG